MTSEPAAETRLQQGDGTVDSTQTGCTSWLLISLLVITLTTSFVFGWGLGAPNMYNRYTERFLKNENPCIDEVTDRLSLNKTALISQVSDTTPVVEISDQENSESQMEKTDDGVAVKTMTKYHKEFNFFAEVKNGFPQTIFLLGAFLGAITGPLWVHIVDRKRTVFTNYIFCFASSLCVLLASYAEQRWLFYLSRLFLGYQGGMACAVVPPYIGEISSQRVRGAAGAAFQLSLTIGILVAQIVGLPFIAGHCERWGWGLAIVFLLPLCGVFLLYLLPNSPTQMIGKYNNEAQAIADLKKLRGTNDIEADLQMIREQTNKAGGGNAKTASWIEVVTSKRYRWPMLVTVLLQFSQALSGINAVFFYSSKMFESAGITSEWIPYANIGTGLINVIATVVSIFLIEKVGRRALIMYPMGAMVLVFSVLTILVRYNESVNSPTLSTVSVIFILIFIVCFAVGLGPIPFLYGTEVCRPEARDIVQSLGLVANYFGNILVSLFFPALNSILGGYVFLIFLVLVLLNVILFWFKMPETKNKSIDEIEKFWNIPPIQHEKLLSQAPTTA